MAAAAEGEKVWERRGGERDEITHSTTRRRRQHFPSHAPKRATVLDYHFSLLLSPCLQRGELLFSGQPFVEKFLSISLSLSLSSRKLSTGAWLFVNLFGREDRGGARTTHGLGGWVVGWGREGNRKFWRSKKGSYVLTRPHYLRLENK